MSRRRKHSHHAELDVPQTKASTAVYLLLLLVPTVACVLFGGVDTATWALLPIAVSAILAIWAYDAFQTGRLSIQRSALPLPLAALALIGLFQLIPTPLASLDPYATRFVTIRLVTYTLFFAAALTYLHSDKRLVWTSAIIVIFGSIMAFLSILQRLADPGLILGIREPAQAVPFGTFVNQHHFASFMVMTNSLALAWLFSDTLGKEKKLIIAAGSLIMCMAVVFTASRGGLLSLIVTVGLVITFTYRTREKRSESKLRPVVMAGAITFAVLTAVLGMALMLGAGSSVERYAGVLAAEDVSNGRWHFWTVGLKVFLDHPLLGAGLDAFGVAFTKHDTWSGVFRIEQAHNDYLQALAEAGVTGFACVVVFIVLLVRRALANIRTAADGRLATVAVGAFAGCVGVLIHSFFDFPLRTPSNAFFFLLLAVLATVRAEDATVHRT